MKADPKEFVQELEPVRSSGSGSGEGSKRMSRRVFLGTGAVAAGGALVIGFTLRKRLHPGATGETTAGEAAGVPREAGGMKQNRGHPLTGPGRRRQYWCAFRWRRASVTSVTFFRWRRVYLVDA